MKTNIEEKYIATLIGCGIGDALGMPIEAWKKGQIKKYVGRITDLIDPVLVKDKNGNLLKEDEFGRLKYWGRDLSKGDYTDDTILTLAIAESIADKKILDLTDICKKQVEVYDSLRKPDGKIRGGFGKSTREAFEKIKLGISPGPGTGPCMKMAPVGLYMHATGKYEEGIKMSRLISRATHLDERSIASGVVQAHAISQLLNEPAKQEFLDSIVNTCTKNERQQEYDALPERGNLSSKLKWVKENQDAPDIKAYAILGCSSLVFEAYPFTIFMFQKYWDKPIEGLIETVNFGGDCDTTGAMYGALAGAKNGMIFPDKWVNELKNSEKIKALGRKMYNLRR
ncbi:MAG: ADP-ribosylglycohydrolase family protein [Candidatus Nanoarchaeia archaeon]|nr:ADP-ribosylglycohydrolase family protein [Candidatus Nanoarchaeia archaeon]MDD5740466.1 ADP-ribosylglycohydrolase family protein [Candidatus Nanoarchaeia archaeon]